MSHEEQDWFLEERSEAFIGLMLTSRPDISIRRTQQHRDGSDFVVGVKEGDSLPTKFFLVQVKGTTSADPVEWSDHVKQFFTADRLYLPVCVFVVNVRQNDAAYAWVAEPEIVNGISRLAVCDKPDFHSLDEQAIDAIVNQVRDWYEAMPHSHISRSA